MHSTPLSRCERAPMSGFRNWDLINLFNFYLALMFLFSVVLRIGQYASFYRIASAFPGRWPNLLGQIRQHWALFLTFGNLLPALTALGLCAANMLACRLVWPHAQLTIGRLFEIG